MSLAFDLLHSIHTNNCSTLELCMISGKIISMNNQLYSASMHSIYHACENSTIISIVLLWQLKQCMMTSFDIILC